VDQTLVNIVAGIVFGGFGWFANALYTQVRELAKELNNLQVQMARDYVSTAELTAVMAHVNKNLDYIRERLDTPQRRHGDLS
jgi:cell division protein FtsB